MFTLSNEENENITAPFVRVSCIRYREEAVMAFNLGEVVEWSDLAGH